MTQKHHNPASPIWEAGFTRQTALLRAGLSCSVSQQPHRGRQPPFLLYNPSDHFLLYYSSDHHHYYLLDDLQHYLDDHLYSLHDLLDDLRLLWDDLKHLCLKSRLRLKEWCRYL